MHLNMSSDSDDSASDTTVVMPQWNSSSQRNKPGQYTECEPEAEAIANAVLAILTAAVHLVPDLLRSPSLERVSMISDTPVRKSQLGSMLRVLNEFLSLRDEGLVNAKVLKTAHVYGLDDTSDIAWRTHAVISTYLGEHGNLVDMVPQARTESSLQELHECIDTVNRVVNNRSISSTMARKLRKEFGVPEDPIIRKGIRKFFRAMNISLSLVSLANTATFHRSIFRPAPSAHRVPTVIYDFGTLTTHALVAHWFKSPAYVILFGPSGHGSAIIDHPEIKMRYSSRQRILVPCEGVDSASDLCQRICQSLGFWIPIDEVDEVPSIFSGTTSLLSWLSSLQGAIICLNGLNITSRCEMSDVEALLSKLSGCQGLSLLITADGYSRPPHQYHLRFSGHVVSQEDDSTISLCDPNSGARCAPEAALLHEIRCLLVAAMCENRWFVMPLSMRWTRHLLWHLRNRCAGLNRNHTRPLPSPESGARRRTRRMKGYFTDDESFEASTDDQSANELEGVIEDERHGVTADTGLVTRIEGVFIATIRRLYANLLPTIDLSAGLNVSITIASSFCDSSTCYRALREAQTDDDFDAIKTSLVEEWKFIATILSAIGGVATTVFVSSPGTIFEPDKVALRCLGLSATTSAIGLFVCFILLYRCLCIDAHAFKNLALGLREDYIYFALTSRLPFLAALLASASIALFLLAVAYRAWPSIVIAVTAVFAILICLQYIVKGGEILYNIACTGAGMLRDRIVPVARLSRDRVTSLFARTVPPQAVTAPPAQAPVPT